MVGSTRSTALLVLVSALLATAGGADVHAYRAQHRIAEDLLPIVEVAMSEGGSVAVDSNSNSLVLVGSKAEISQALALLELQDRRLRSVLIEHEARTLSELEASGVRIRWSVGGNAFRVGNIVPAPDGSALSIEVAERARSGQLTRTGSVRVLEGSWGRIASGSELLVPIGSSRNPSTARVTAESGLEVRPRILGDGRIRLDLRPFQGSLGREESLARGGVVNRSSAETMLVVAPGETAVVGSLAVVGGGSSESLLSEASRRRAHSQQLLLVTATIDEK